MTDSPIAEGLFTDAEAYAKYRLRHSSAFYKCLVRKFSLTKESTVVDLGCGPGMVALDIASYVDRVIAVDIEQAALDKGKSLAQERGVQNVEWFKCRSEDILSINRRADLTVMADSFHWMECKKVLDDLFLMTNDGGGIVISGLLGTVKPDFCDDLFKTVPVVDTPKAEVANKAVAKGMLSRDLDFVKKSSFTDYEIINLERTVPSTKEDIFGLYYYTTGKFQQHREKCPEKFRAWLTEYLDAQTDFTLRGFETAILAYKRSLKRE